MMTGILLGALLANGSCQLRSGHEMYSYKHVLRSKHVIVGMYMHIESV